MRKFRFIGDPKEWNGNLVKGEIYDGNYSDKDWKGKTVIYCADFIPEDWEEVFDQPKAMRKFRFIGDPDKENYKGLVNGKEYYKHDSLPSVVGTPIYNDDFIEYYIEAYQKDWQEVFDPVEPVKGAQFTDIPKVAKHLHKDTDLGYFAGLIAQGLASNSLIDQNKTDIESIAVLRAEELIRQLDERAK